VFAGVPVKLGAGGIEQVIEVKLNAEEKAGFVKSVEAVKSGCARFM
jgi:malate dehydrogenase